MKRITKDLTMDIILPDDLKHIFFDMCVNQGRRTAVRVLQRAINGKGGKLSIDGGFGPGTKSALAKHKPSVARVRCYRLKHYYDLVNKKPKQERFLFGWFNRALSVQEFKMAKIKEIAKKAAKKVKKSAKKAKPANKIIYPK